MRIVDDGPKLIPLGGMSGIESGCSRRGRITPSSKDGARPLLCSTGGPMRPNGRGAEVASAAPIQPIPKGIVFADECDYIPLTQKMGQVDL